MKSASENISKGYRSQPEGPPTGHIGDNLYLKINSDVNIIAH